VITLLSAFLARMQRVAALPIITEHLVIAIVVVAISHYIGAWVNSAFA
jgi:hypothetical protein